MSERKKIELFFNFRSPYCYFASQRMWSLFDEFDVDLGWRPLGGWNGRSAPERAKRIIPTMRQDMARWARRLGVPFTPPPASTDGTRAGAASLLVEQRGLLRPYVSAMMDAVWGQGLNIAEDGPLLMVAAKVGIDGAELLAAADDARRGEKLLENWRLAESSGVFGVPSFLLGEQIFWGNDRIEFVADYLREQGLAKV
ncbi:MAG: DsbA family protein [Gammaproteobacteria bacterium]|nr:DsbA family protein [Gammaproteobacteria bacterium]